jgi:uncharacterized repeat protein (TIGR01451 family)
LVFAASLFAAFLFSAAQLNGTAIGNTLIPLAASRAVQPAEIPARGELRNAIPIPIASSWMYRAPEARRMQTGEAETADLSLAKKAAPEANLLAGGEVTYTLVVENTGPSTASDVIVSDTLPDEIQNTHYSEDEGENWLPWTGSLNLGDLEPEMIKTLLIRGTVMVDQGTTISNTAEVRGSTEDPDPKNNQASADVNALPQADLQLKKSASDVIYRYQVLTYSLEIKNLGPSKAAKIQVNDPLPDGLTFISASDACRYDMESKTVICEAEELGAEESLTYTIQVRPQ